MPELTTLLAGAEVVDVDFAPSLSETPTIRQRLPLLASAKRSCAG